MWERGDAWLALAYAFGSVFAGLLAVALGLTLARYIAPEVNEQAVVAASALAPGEEERVWVSLERPSTRCSCC
jgi:hypothetical protein